MVPLHIGVLQFDNGLKINFQEGGWVEVLQTCLGLPGHLILPLVIFSSGVMYAQNPRSIKQLQAMISEVMQQIPQEMIDRSIENFRKRINRISESEGGHIDVSYSNRHS